MASTAMAQAESATAPETQGLIESHFPDAFARYAPRSALDMLQQVPGFAIRDESSARGLGQASGNVLINGQRPSSKSGGARDQLGRIPIGNVVRIDIVEGTALDIPGLTGLVANVIVKAGGLAGQFEWRVQLPTDHAAGKFREGEVSVSGQTSGIDYTIALSNNAFRGGNVGPNILSDGRGAQLDRRVSATKSFNDQPRVSATLRRESANGVNANLNLSYRRYYFRSREDEIGIAPELAPTRLEALRVRRSGDDFEVGGDLEFGLGKGRLKLIGLRRAESGDFSTQTITSLDQVAESGSRFELASSSSETILRGEYGLPFWGADWQLSGEAAFNRLDNVAGLFGLDANGDFVEIDFPQGSGGVREKRYETILSVGRGLNDMLTLQVTAGAELSTISQTGTQAAERTFFRPKGSLSLAWKPGPELDLVFELRRTVGQLDFADFLAEVNLGDNNQNAANSQLVPEQRWIAEIKATRTLGAWGSITGRIFRHWIDDFVAIVPVDDGLEARGNIDRATVFGVALLSTIQLDGIGIPAAKVTVDAKYRFSRLSDPVTGTMRAFDNIDDWNIDIDFRHDIPSTDWAWGFSFRDTHTEPYYRLMERGLSYAIRTSGNVFVEHKDVLGLTVQARIGNIFNNRSVLYRTIYDGPRGSGSVLFVEDRRRQIGRVWNIRVSGSF